jgi:hypothetical protein
LTDPHRGLDGYGCNRRGARLKAPFDRLTALSNVEG